MQDRGTTRRHNCSFELERDNEFELETRESKVFGAEFPRVSAESAFLQPLHQI